MLTEEQAQQLNLNQHALEAAEIGYNKASAELNRYDELLNWIKNNYSTYTPEQKEKLSAMMPEVTAKYNELKAKKEQYFMDQYEAKQQIDYYNNLSA